MLIVAFSGGKDSTAMALRMAELGESFKLLHTPTGNEPPGLAEHIQHVAVMTSAELVLPKAPTLAELIKMFNALPNFRQRWCTRMIKIAPCAAWLMEHPGSTLCVGLRADEEEREGMYGDHAAYRYPLREWGWGVTQVMSYIESKEVCIPIRTDCAVCPYQRLSDWQRLWLDHPDLFAEGERWEEETGHTFRTPGRDTWPVALKELRIEFENGRQPPHSAAQLELFTESCRVCRF